MLQRLKEQFPEGKRNSGWTVREAQTEENSQQEVSKVSKEFDEELLRQEPLVATASTKEGVKRNLFRSGLKNRKLENLVSRQKKFGEQSSRSRNGARLTPSKLSRLPTTLVQHSQVSSWVTSQHVRKEARDRRDSRHKLWNRKGKCKVKLSRALSDDQSWLEQKAGSSAPDFWAGQERVEEGPNFVELWGNQEESGEGNVSRRIEGDNGEGFIMGHEMGEGGWEDQQSHRQVQVTGGWEAEQSERMVGLHEHKIYHTKTRLGVWEEHGLNSMIQSLGVWEDQEIRDENIRLGGLEHQESQGMNGGLEGWVHEESQVTNSILGG